MELHFPWCSRKLVTLRNPVTRDGSRDVTWDGSPDHPGQSKWPMWRHRTWREHPAVTFEDRKQKKITALWSKKVPLSSLLMVQTSGSPVEVGSLSHDLQGFANPRWLFGISSINSINISALGRVISIFFVPFPSASWPMRHPCISATAHRKAAAPRLISAMLTAYMLVVPARNLASLCIFRYLLSIKFVYILPLCCFRTNV